MLKESRVRKPRRPPIHKNPQILRALVALQAAGLSRPDVMAGLRISLGTYYKCRDTLEAVKTARADTDAD